jgi:two-component sensor histidine kinase
MHWVRQLFVLSICLMGICPSVRARHIARDSLARQAQVHSTMANAYFAKGNYQLALRHSLTALDLRRTTGDAFLIAQSLNDIGLVYWSKQDYSNSIKYYRESLALKQQLRDSTGTLTTLLAIAQSFYTNRQYDSTHAYAFHAQQLATQLNRPEKACLALAFMGKAQIAFKRFDKAIALLRESENSALVLQDKKALATIYEALGDIYLEQKKHTEALSHYKKGLSITRSINDLEQMAMYYRKFLKCYRQMGALQTAFLYMDSARNLSHELLNVEIMRQMNEMGAVYEAAEKEKQIATLHAQNTIAQAEATQRKRERNYFIISSVLLMALAVVIWQAFAGNKKKQALLNRQKTIIEQSLQEKEILMKEIHHRVKNNLQLVSSLLSLQADYITDELALDAVKESRNRVTSMALIHQNLYEEDHFTSIPIQEYISKLCDNLFYSYNIHPGTIRLVKEIEPLLLDVEIVVPLGLILNELITNCLKYAFPNKQTGVIRIIVKKEGDKLHVCVYDNGAGLPAHFSPDHTATFGYKMIRAFTQKMKGHLHVYNDEGACVELILKYNKPVGYGRDQSIDHRG